MYEPTDDAMASVEAEFPSLLPHELGLNDDNQIYQSDTPSLEDYSNDTEFGQELIDLLLQRGEIKLKSSDNDDDVKFRRGENVKNDRYDELINAFNVILDEILRQGKLTKHSDQENNEQSHNQVDDNTEDTQRKSRSKSSSKCSTGRCLNTIESELLQKIKMLNSQLNTVIKHSGKDKPKRCKSGGADLLDDSIKVALFGKRPIKLPEQVPTTNDHFDIVSQLMNEETGELAGKHSGSSTIEKRHAQPDEAKENELNKQNNYGVERPKFVKDDPESSPQNSSKVTTTTTPPPESTTTPPSESTTAPPVETTTPAAEPVFVGGRINIPMRIVKGTNGDFKLVLDRRALCRNSAAQNNKK